MAACSGASSSEPKNCARLGDGHRADFGDRFSGDAHGARFGAQARAVAFGADGVSAIAAEKNAHVQFVFFAFEPGEEALDAGIIRAWVALDDGVALLGGELAEGHVERESRVTRAKCFRSCQSAAIAWLGPRLDRRLR